MCLIKILSGIYNIAIITVKGVDHRCIIYGVRKSGVTRFLENKLLKIVYSCKMVCKKIDIRDKL